MSNQKEQDARPQIAWAECRLLVVTIDGHEIRMDAVNGMQFYRLCRSFLTGRPMAWAALRETLVSEECDDDTKWYAVLELLRSGAVEVREGVIVAKAKKERVA